jgi:aspartate/methionine/tyrosine aminotransferase
MAFSPVEYMEWAKLRSAARTNLSRSGMPLLGREEVPLSFDGLDINGGSPYGFPPLLEAIAARHGTVPSSVVPTLGTSEAIFIVCAALLERGETAVVETPSYEPMLSCARAVGASVCRFERRFEDRYRIDPDAFAAAIPEGTKLVLMTNLHNPSGAFLSGDEVGSLARLAGGKGAVLFVDEIYLEHMPGAAARTAFGRDDNICVSSSLTKVFGLPGLRCGWILAPARLAEKMRRVTDHLHVDHVFLAEQLAARMFPLLDVLKSRTQAARDANRGVLGRFLAGETRLSWVEPDAGIVAFPRVAGRLDGGDTLARILRERYETSVVPGSFFEAPSHVRIGFGVPSDELETGLRNISLALDDLGGQD